MGTAQVGEELAATDAGEVEVEQDEIHVLDRLRRNGGEVPLGFDSVGGFHNAPLRALEEAPKGESAEPLVVAEMESEIPTLSVGEAVMRLDLADLPAMMFRNQANGVLNVVYRRPDGNIGWIDPANTRTTLRAEASWKSPNCVQAVCCGPTS